MSRLSSSRDVLTALAAGVVVLLALLGAGGLLVSGFRPWVTGAVDDAVLGATRISATGAEVAPGLSAVALSIAAAAIAAVAAGRIARVVALVAYATSVVIAVILTVRVLRDPEAVLGPVAASRVGRTGSIENVADPTVWPWVALAACAVALLGLVGALRGGGCRCPGRRSARRARRERLGRAQRGARPHRCGSRPADLTESPVSHRAPSVGPARMETTWTSTRTTGTASPPGRQ